MHNEQHACYKLHAITTRWVEAFDWSARPGTNKATHSVLRSFSASFSIAPPTGNDAWQEFAGKGFGTPGQAAAEALIAARRSIDQSLSGIWAN